MVEKVLGELHLIETSTISMCLSQYQLADFRETKSGGGIILISSFVMVLCMKTAVIVKEQFISTAITTKPILLTSEISCFHCSWSHTIFVAILVSNPNEMILTPARLADETQVDTLISLDKNVLNVFDRGNVNFALLLGKWKHKK